MQEEAQQQLIVAGYIRIPVQWFEKEPDTKEVRSFTVYRSHDDVIPHPTLRAFWLSRIIPVYANHDGSPLEEQPMVSWFDTKTNPRRVHPFAHVYISWAERVMMHVHTGKGNAPVCILKRRVLRQASYCPLRGSLWEESQVEEEYEYESYDGLPALFRLQAWCRLILAQRKAREKRLSPDNLFHGDKESLEFGIRFRKAGIDIQTYHTMSSSSTSSTTTPCRG
jgi:hypothetical protein